MPRSSIEFNIGGRTVGETSPPLVIAEIGINHEGNIEKALRMVDALQYHEKHGEVCPANWTQGEDGMKPDPEGSQEYFSKHN